MKTACRNSRQAVALGKEGNDRAFKPSRAAGLPPLIQQATAAPIWCCGNSLSEWEFGQFIFSGKKVITTPAIAIILKIMDQLKSKYQNALSPNSIIVVAFMCHHCRLFNCLFSLCFGGNKQQKQFSNERYRNQCANDREIGDSKK